MSRDIYTVMKLCVRSCWTRDKFGVKDSFSGSENIDSHIQTSQYSKEEQLQSNCLP